MSGITERRRNGGGKGGVRSASTVLKRALAPVYPVFYKEIRSLLQGDTTGKYKGGREKEGKAERSQQRLLQKSKRRKSVSLLPSMFRPSARCPLPMQPSLPSSY